MRAEGAFLRRAHQPQLFPMLLSSRHSPQPTEQHQPVTDIPEPREGAGTHMTHMTHVFPLPVVTNLCSLGYGGLGEVPDSDSQLTLASLLWRVGGPAGTQQSECRGAAGLESGGLGVELEGEGQRAERGWLWQPCPWRQGRQGKSGRSRQWVLETAQLQRGLQCRSPRRG